ncbi:MAG: DNA adenine methylase [Lentimicrobiaceae bacterium]|nr:DNA adenine methylase [Lentimicrobiaceae bacterium]
MREVVKVNKVNQLIHPFLKWAGGKRQILPVISNHLPSDIHQLHYIEPFVGGGAVLFFLQPGLANISDLNTELINVYQVIKEQLNELITELKRHKNDSDYFYKIRNLDRNPEYQQLSAVQRASRIIFLNKTCFNGLYRVNKAGQFNVPFGKYKNPAIVNEASLKAVSHYLNTNRITIKSCDYADILSQAGKGTFVYLDPPYHPIAETSNFTGYVQGGWNQADQERLKRVFDELNARGAYVLQSNSAAPLIKDLYRDYNITTIQAGRAINSVGSSRGKVDELLIKNYG